MGNFLVMGVFPHPDDEFSAAGALIKALSRGMKVSLVCATKGEAGKILNDKKKLLQSMTPAQIREEEYKEACSILGISKYCFLGLKDGEGRNWDEAEAVKTLTDIMNIEKPDIVFSFDKNGFNGHPDHKALSCICKAACAKQRAALIQVTKFPESFASRKLWWIPGKFKKKIMSQICIEDNKVTEMYKLTKEELAVKLRALECYKSQFPDEKNRYYKQPKFILKLGAAYESYYIEADSLELIKAKGWGFN